MPDVILVEVQDPSGLWTDVTDRCDIGSLGSINYAVEDGLLQFRTGDVTIGADNTGDFWRLLFAGALPTQTWKLRISRNAVKCFEGVIYLPASLKFNEVEVSCEVTAFGYLKLLDLIDASVVKRTFVATTGSGSSGTTTVTFSPGVPTGLVQGDQFDLTSANTKESCTVQNILNSTQVQITQNLGSTWPAGSEVEFTTPYHRQKTIEWLVEELFDAAGITDPVIDTTGQFSPVLVSQPINTDGITAGSPKSVVQQTASGVKKITATFSAGNRKVATSVSSGFASGTASNIAQIDWRPYLATEPATIAQGNQGQEQDGPAADHTGGHRYTLRLFDNGGALNALELWLQRDAVDLVKVDSYGSTGHPTFDNCYLDYEPVNDRVWVSARRAFTGLGVFKVYDIGGATLTDLGDMVKWGPVRTIASLNVVAFRNRGTGGTTMTLYDPLTMASGTVITIPATLNLWSMRYVRGYVIGLYRQSGATRARVWKPAGVGAQWGWTQVADYEVNASAAAGSLLMTVFTDAALGRDMAIGWDGSAWFVIDDVYSGVVQYADFSGITVASALASLATICNAVAFVDNDYNGYFVARSSQALSPSPKRLLQGGENPADPSDVYILAADETDQVWSSWLGSVIVSVSSGTLNVNVSGNTITVDQKFVTSTAVAFGIGLAYSAFYSQPRRERRVTVDDDGTIYYPLNVVAVGNSLWWVYEAQHNLPDREVGLRLVEIV